VIKHSLNEEVPDVLGLRDLIDHLQFRGWRWHCLATIHIFIEICLFGAILFFKFFDVGDNFREIFVVLYHFLMMTSALI
jgi:hypothetical protein